MKNFRTITDIKDLEPYGSAHYMSRYPQLRTIIESKIPDPFSAKAHLCMGRLTGDHGNLYTVTTGKEDHTLSPAGRLRLFQGSSFEDATMRPAVGDWLLLSVMGEEPQLVRAILPRYSSLSRKEAGRETKEQVIASNIDTVFIVNGLDHNFNLRRIERYITIAYNSGSSPVVVLNKLDLCDDLAAKLALVEEIARDIPVICCSAVEKIGLDEFTPYISGGKTAVLVGSSGVGKSSLLNLLLGKEHQAVRTVRDADGKGRHTTTSRELFTVPDQGCLIDTPGMRELGLWAGDQSLGSSFADIEEIAARCRFRDCSHETEPGCAIQAALNSGALSRERYESYQKQQREIAYLERRKDERAWKEEREKWKKIAKMAAEHVRQKRGG